MSPINTFEWNDDLICFKKSRVRLRGLVNLLATLVQRAFLHRSIRLATFDRVHSISYVRPFFVVHLHRRLSLNACSRRRNSSASCSQTVDGSRGAELVTWPNATRRFRYQFVLDMSILSHVHSYQTLKKKSYDSWNSTWHLRFERRTSSLTRRHNCLIFFSIQSSFDATISRRFLVACHFLGRWLMRSSAKPKLAFFHYFGRLWKCEKSQSSYVDSNASSDAFGEIATRKRFSRGGCTSWL